MKNDGDYLPMWSMYGANGSGVSLGFDSSTIKKYAQNADIGKCIYNLNKNKFQAIIGVEKLEDILIDFSERPENLSKEECISQFFKNVSKLISVISIVFYAKNQSYEYEDELRLITNLKLAKDNFDTIEEYLKICEQQKEHFIKLPKQENDKVKYRIKDNLIIPYIENHFPKEALQKIIIGPTSNMELSKHSLRVYLDHLGYEHVEITRSKVPYQA